MSEIAEYKGPPMSSEDTGFIEAMRNSNIPEFSNWCIRATTIIFLSERLGLFSEFYKLPSILDRSARDECSSPDAGYFKLRDFLKDNYDFLFSKMKYIDAENVVSSDKVYIRLVIANKFHPAMKRLWSELQKGPSRSTVGECASLVNLMRHLFCSGYAPTAIAMAFDALKAKYVISCSEFKNITDGLCDDALCECVSHLQRCFPENYNELEKDLCTIFSEACKISKMGSGHDEFDALLSMCESEVWKVFGIAPDDLEYDG